MYKYSLFPLGNRYESLLEQIYPCLILSASQLKRVKSWSITFIASFSETSFISERNDYQIGWRQRDPLSLSFSLSCAEASGMSFKQKEGKIVKAINNREHTISQYAENISPSLHG